MRDLETRKEAAIGASLALATLLWLSGALAAPLLEAAGGRTIITFLSRGLYSTVCHQIPDRSFSMAGHPVALCARCTGLYGGFLIGCLVVAAGTRAAGWHGARPGRGFLIVASIPTVLEAAAEWSGLWAGSGLVRALTGAMLAAPLAPLVATAVRELPAEIAGEISRSARPRGRSHAGTC